MSTRHTLYHAFCLASSGKEVLKGSASVAKESLVQWVNTSCLTRPILMQYKFYYDPEWENARKLSQEVKSKGHPQTKRHKRKPGARHYSTSSRPSTEKVCN